MLFNVKCWMFLVKGHSRLVQLCTVKHDRDGHLLEKNFQLLWNLFTLNTHIKERCIYSFYKLL
uniref:Uncharacterized protein n=1 Tax=Mola mola TaxID=94237 RepID=A0A3Q4BV56_MOLML